LRATPAAPGRPGRGGPRAHRDGRGEGLGEAGNRSRECREKREGLDRLTDPTAHPKREAPPMMKRILRKKLSKPILIAFATALFIVPAASAMPMTDPGNTAAPQAFVVPSTT